MSTRGGNAKVGQAPAGAMRVERLEQGRDLLDLHRAQPTRYPHLLESVAHGPCGRFDILFACPQGTLTLTASGLERDGQPIAAGGFLAELDREWRAQAQPPSPSSLPFRGGWFLYLGYELAAEVEPRLTIQSPEAGLPIAFAMRIPAAFIRDHEAGCLYVVAETGYETLIDTLKADLATAPATAPVAPAARLAEDPPPQFTQGVEQIKRYIRDGDVFQVNLSRAWQGSLDSAAGPEDLYRRLREANPGPFAGLATYGHATIVSSSPERLLRVHGDWIETRPIAGTRPRSTVPNEDQLYSRELMAHPKERAEHVMLIDLERNDLGRVCWPGTIEVNELMALESYAHVHHIVSNVRGRLRADMTPGAAIRAVFPGGTITGCPKVRCMEIIAELEQTPRGAYTGSFGYLNRDGSMDLNILIRTISTVGHRLTLRAGAGIVADSDPQRELEETRSKARGMLVALGAEEGGGP